MAVLRSRQELVSAVNERNAKFVRMSPESSGLPEGTAHKSSRQRSDSPRAKPTERSVGKAQILLINLAAVARLTGLEPATPGVTGRYSNQLSYNRPLQALKLPSKRLDVIWATVPSVKTEIPAKCGKTNSTAFMSAGARYRAVRYRYHVWPF